jgi:hypothetical protein
MLISEAYKAQNKQLHSAGNYGVSGSKWGQQVAKLAGMMGANSILDYGCGQRLLEKAFRELVPTGYDWRNYDPCIEGLDATAEPADLVVCSDVLEHIEPECLDAVLDDLERVTLTAGLFVIANRPAKKILPDGRNAHLIQQGPRWWLPKLCARFEIVNVMSGPGEFVVVVRHA